MDFACANLITKNFPSFYTFEDINLTSLNKYFSNDMKNTTSKIDNRELYKNWDDLKLQQLIYFLCIVIYARKSILNNLNEIEEEEMIKKYFDLLINLKNEFNLHFFEELKSFSADESDALLYHYFKRYSETIKFKVILYSSRKFIEFHDFQLEHISKHQLY